MLSSQTKVLVYHLDIIIINFLEDKERDTHARTHAQKKKKNLFFWDIFPLYSQFHVCFIHKSSYFHKNQM